jgi:hypothetical protein
MTLRPLYARLLKRWRAILLDLFGITGFAPRLTMSARKSSPSYPLSAMSEDIGGASARRAGAAAISASWPGVTRALQQKAPLLDHLVSEQLKRIGDLASERAGGQHIDHELELRRL